MADISTSVLERKQEPLLTPGSIDTYLQTNSEDGVAPSAIVKYKDTFTNLRHWLAEDLRLNAARLLEWRKHLGSFGYQLAISSGGG